MFQLGFNIYCEVSQLKTVYVRIHTYFTETSSHSCSVPGSPARIPSFSLPFHQTRRMSHTRASSEDAKAAIDVPYRMTVSTLCRTDFAASAVAHNNTKSSTAIGRILSKDRLRKTKRSKLFFTFTYFIWCIFQIKIFIKYII